jgi:flagellar basal body-associated protein FliL
MSLPIPKGKRAILVLGLPLGLAAAGAFAFMQMSAAGSTPPPAVPDPGAGQVGPILALEDRVINLSTADVTSYKYAKIGVSIEVRPAAESFYELHGAERTKAEATELEKYQDQVPRLLDALGSVVSAHDSSTLTTPDGRAQLKEELLEAFRTILGTEDVIDVFFTNFVMQ